MRLRVRPAVAQMVSASLLAPAMANPMCTNSEMLFAHTQRCNGTRRFAASAPGGPRGAAALPIKDRYPPAAYDPADMRRRIVVLVDGELVSKRSYDQMLPRIASYGSVILTRVFAHTLKPDWQPDVIARKVEWFRVEKFIPVHMQLAADASHVGRFRADNATQGIAMLVNDAETAQYESYFTRPHLDGVNLYCFGDSKGLTKFVNVDGRTADGSAASSNPSVAKGTWQKPSAQ
jgi:hypothetical protein